MNTLMEAAEFELMLEEWALFYKSWNEVEVKEPGDQGRGTHALILMRIEWLLQTVLITASITQLVHPTWHPMTIAY